MSRRKFKPNVRNIFGKWMSFGGIDVFPKAYTGNIDPEELQHMTAREKKEATTAKPSICGEEADEDGNPIWEVDFEAVTKAFLYDGRP